MAKRRIKKKHYRIVREALEAGKVVPRFQLMRVFKYWDDFFHRQYITVFRPWWYEQDWNKLDFEKVHKNHFKETMDTFAAKTGIDMIQFGEELKRQRKQKPRKPRPRKEKAPDPIRKLRNPVPLKIRMSQTEYRTVTAEKVFDYYGNPFYIYHDERTGWRVTCGATGVLVTWDERYKKAVTEAKRLLQEMGEQSYLNQVVKIGNITDGSLNLTERRQEDVEKV